MLNNEFNFNRSLIKSNRIPFIDAIRGIAILTVIFGHCIQYGSGHNFLNDSSFFNNIFFKFIYGFHMPLFMLISGFCFAFSKDIQLNKYLTNKIVKYLILIIVWDCISILLSFLQNHINPVTSFKSFVTLFISEPWFLWAIIWSMLIFYVLYKLFNYELIPHIFISIIFMFIPDKFNFALIKYTYIFFPIGFLLNIKGFINANPSKRIIKLFLYFISYIGLLFLYKTNIYIYISGYSLIEKDALMQIHNNVIRFVTALIGCLFIFYLFEILSNKFSFKTLEYYGKNSLAIYTSSTIIFNRLLIIATYNYSGFNFFSCLIETFCVSFLCFSFVIVAKRFKLSRFLLLGRS